MYSERLIEHFRNPRNTGELNSPGVTVEVSNPACGDILRLSVLVQGGRIADARYRTRGCTASIAAGSALTEWLIGKGRTEAGALTTADIEASLGGLSGESRHAAVLCVEAVRALLKTGSL